MNPETIADKPNPVEQFELHRLWPQNLSGVDVSFTNASLYMTIAALGVVLLMVVATAPGKVTPGRFQSLAEMLYEFVENMVRQVAGEEGLRFFPFVFTLFTFLLICNLMGLFPYTFSVTSQIVVTFSFAMLVCVDLWASSESVRHVPSGVLIAAEEAADIITKAPIPFHPTVANEASDLI